MQILLLMFSSCLGTVPHTQMNSSTIVTMTMASHSSHATAVTTSTIPVGKLAFLSHWFSLLLCENMWHKQEVLLKSVFSEPIPVSYLSLIVFLQLKWSLSPSPTLHPVCSLTTQEKDPASSLCQALGHLLTLSPWNPEVTPGEHSMHDSHCVAQYVRK